jgi:hypothetical protein
MDVGEMSAGLLSIRSAEQWSFEVHNSSPPDFVEPTDQLIHDFLKRKMSDATRRRGTSQGRGVAKFARYMVSGPLLPTQPGQPFAQAFEGRLGLKVIDLPGLRTLDDPDNFAVIASTVRMAFPLILVNWNDLHARETRQKLLKEVRQSLRDLDARESMVLFLLNKVDAWTPTDRGVDTILEELTAEFRQALDFTHAELIPMSGLHVLAGARLKVAASEGAPTPETLQLAAHALPFVQRHLKAHFDTDQDSVETGRKAWRQTRSRLRDIQDALEEGLTPRPQEATWFAEQCMLAGGGARLWSALLERMQQHTASLVIHPATKTLRGHLGDIWRQLDAFLDGRVAATLADVASRTDDLKDTRRIVDKVITDRRSSLQATVRSIPTVVREASGYEGAEAVTIEKVLTEVGLNTSDHPTIFNVRSSMSEVIQTLRAEVVRPITDAMVAFKPGKDLAVLLEGRISVSLADDLSNAWNDLRACTLYSAEVAREGLDKTIDRDKYDSASVKAASKAYTELLLVTRAILSLEGDRVLKTQATALKRELKTWTEQVGVGTWNKAAEVVASQIDTTPLRPALTASDLAVPDIQLPPEMLQVGRPELTKASERTATRTVYVDRRVKESRGSCKEDKVVVKRVPKKQEHLVKTVRITFPSADDIHDQIIEALTSQSEEFWNAYLSWLEEALDSALEQVAHLAGRALRAAAAGLDARRRELEASGKSEVARWEALRGEVATLQQLQSALNRLAGASA